MIWGEMIPAASRRNPRGGLRLAGPAGAAPGQLVGPGRVLPGWPAVIGRGTLGGQLGEAALDLLPDPAERAAGAAEDGLLDGQQAGKADELSRRRRARKTG